MKQILQYIRNNHGVTLIELAVYSAVSAVVVLGASQFMTFFSKTQKTAEKFAEATLEEQNINNFLFSDIKEIFLSFQLPSLAPLDIGTGNLFFFDYSPASWCSGKQCERTHVIEPGQSEDKYFYLVMSERRTPPVMLSPVSFYDANRNPLFGARGTLAFSQLKFKNVFDTIDEAKNYLSPGKTLAFYSPIALKGANSTTSRFPTIFAEVTSELKLNPVFPFLKNQPHPKTTADFSKSYQGYDPLDAFIRLLPPIGGRATVLQVSPVKFVRYSVRALQSSPGDNALYMETYSNSKWGEPLELGRKVAKVTFKRRNISIASIDVNVESLKAGQKSSP